LVRNIDISLTVINQGVDDEKLFFVIENTMFILQNCLSINLHQCQGNWSSAALESQGTGSISSRGFIDAKTNNN
jgi:hypothetical protein